VARDFGLPNEWMNNTVGMQWRTGLPPGLAGRLHWRQYGALRVGLADRHDLVFMKLLASVYHAVHAEYGEDLGSVHLEDLLALGPNEEELRAAARWARTQEMSPGTAKYLDEVVEHVRRASR
jgi:hypothetical protein